MLIFKILLCLLNDTGREQLGDVFEKLVIQGIRRVGVTMIVVVPKLRSIRPHHRRYLVVPERSVIAAGQHGEIFFQAELHIQTGHGQFRHIGSGMAQHQIHGRCGTAICQQAGKIAGVADLHRQTGRQVLGTGRGTGVSHHFQHVRATDAEPGFLQIRLYKVAAAQQAVLFAVESDKDDRQNTGCQRLHAAAQPSMAATALPLSSAAGHMGTES